MIKLNIYVPETLIFSSDMPALEFKTDKASLNISVNNATSNTQIFSTTLYAVNGVVSVYDMKQLVEQYMRDNTLAYLNCNIIASAGSETCNVTLYIIYCSQRITITAPKLAKYFFLTSQKSKEVNLASYSEDELTFFAEKGEDISSQSTLIYSTPDGSMHRYYTSAAMVAEETGIISRYLTLTECWRTIGGERGNTLHSFTYEVGERMFTYYFTDDIPQLQFIFRNAFNVSERITLFGKTTTVIKSKKSEAICGGRTIYYDRSNEKEYEFESVRLSPEKMRWVEQLILSHNITRYESDKYRVLITAFTYEVADDDKEDYIIKFTWRYADDDFFIEFPYSLNTRIFTQEYDETFT